MTDEPNRDDDYESRNPQPEPADTIARQGKRVRWQCGCRQRGGVLVQQSKPHDPDIDDLIDAAKAVIRVYREPVGDFRVDFARVVKRLIDLIEAS